MKIILKTIIAAIAFPMIICSTVKAGTEYPTIDRNNYRIEMAVYDNDTGGPVTSSTTHLRRLYSIVNESNRQIIIPHISISGFGIVNLTTNTFLESGGTGNGYNNIIVPPHSTKLFGNMDISNIEKPSTGHYRCVSGMDIYLSRSTSTNIFTAQAECVIYVE